MIYVLYTVYIYIPPLSQAPSARKKTYQKWQLGFRSDTPRLTVACSNPKTSCGRSWDGELEGFSALWCIFKVVKLLIPPKIHRSHPKKGTISKGNIDFFQWDMLVFRGEQYMWIKTIGFCWCLTVSPIKTPLCTTMHNGW